MSSRSPAVVPADQARGLRAMQKRTAPAPWLAVTGGKGGVGKTTLAVNLALLLQRAGRRTLLVDLDPGLGNVDVHLRLAPHFTVEDIANGVCSPAAAVVDGPGRLRVLAGRSGSTQMTGGDAAFLPKVLAAVAAAAATSDLVVCDTGAGIGPAVLAVALRAEQVMAVTTADPSALTDTYAMCKVLHARGRQLPGLVVNRVRSRDEAMRTAGKLTTVCRKFLSAELPLLGWVSVDGMLELSVAEQRPFALHGQGPAMEDLRGLCAGVLSAMPGPRA
ncbi:MAG TPA: P-loop NTPase [Planctomycetota bacterium]|nr:P-loop NTPase [Planctomycetota bacterium]